MEKRRATNISLVSDLTQDFMKEFGKKDLTRRHVMSFLSKSNTPQFLASDIIRCLKLRHSVYVKDVLDEFPIAKTASDGKLSLAAVRAKLVMLESGSAPNVSRQLKQCSAHISSVIKDLEDIKSEI